MKIFPFQAFYPNTDLIASPDTFFATVREEYPQYFENGFFNQSPEKSYYLLEIIEGKKIRTGLVTALEVRDYSRGNIVRHEQTIEKNEQEMLQVLLERNAMVKPVLVCHPQHKSITREIRKLKKKKKPFLSVTAGTAVITYHLYMITRDEGTKLRDLYDTHVPKVYIADGHHRCSTGEKLLALQPSSPGKDYSLLLTTLFPFDQLDILDYNRIVQLPDNISVQQFLRQAGDVAKITRLRKARKPSKKHELTMFLKGKWYKLAWKEEVLDRYRSSTIFDAHVLDKEILERILGITDVRTDSRVEYVPGDQGASKVEDKAGQASHSVGFCIYPVQFDELVEVSDRGGTLPPKSTWFQPRMLNGLVVKSYE